MGYLSFQEIGTSTSGKTKIWNALSNTKTALAAIAWYTPWRKYCVSFDPKAVFDPSCLREIADFAENKTKEHKN